MTRSTFSEALREVLPVSFSEESLPPVAPDGQMSVRIHVQPMVSGVRVSIALGDDPPHLLEYASEEAAAASLGEIFASVMEP